MKRLRIAFALALCGLSTAAMATSTSTWTDLGGRTPTATTGITTWQGSPTFSQYCTYGTSGCGAQGGTNYGNTASFANTAGTAASVTMSGYGTMTLATSGSNATIQKGWLGDYNSPNGYGVTGQSNGELNGSNQPAATQSTGYQHAVDNILGYDLLLLNFSTAVTLNSLSIGFGYNDTDATVLEYIGSGAPGLIGNTLTQLLCTVSITSNCWKVAYNLFNMTVGNPNYQNAPTSLVNPLVASQYWMVGAYIPSFGGNGAGDGVADVFKVNGFSVTSGFVNGQSVPEPASIALFGIAGLAFAASRRRFRKA